VWWLVTNILEENGASIFMIDSGTQSDKTSNLTKLLLLLLIIIINK
jgi:hypothetical protein